MLSEEEFREDLYGRQSQEKRIIVDQDELIEASKDENI